MPRFRVPRSPETALKNYTQSQDVHAGRRHGENIAKLRRHTQGISERAFAERDVPHD